MPYLGNQHNVGDHVNNFKVLDDISSHTATFNGSATSVVSAADDTIRIPEHRFIQGQRVTYTNGGGGNIGGLTSGTAYFVSFDSANTIKLATTLANANSNTVINLSSVGSGTSHTLNAAFDGVNTKFKISYRGGTSARLNNATQINVAINNVIQRPNQSSLSFTEGFAIEDNHKIVFKVAPTVNDIFWGSIIANTIENFDLRDNEVDNFTGDGSTTEFTLSTIPANNESVMVSLDGVLQHPSDKDTSRSYTLLDSIIQFTAAPGNGVEIQVRHIGFAGASTNDVSGFYGRSGNVTLTANDHITTGDITSRNINSSGIITATSFVGSGANLTGIDATAVKDASGNVKIQAQASGAIYTGIHTFTTLKSSSGDFSGNVSIGGTLTYEDVTNIDSVGIITARDDIKIIADNKKLKLGAGEELQLYQSGNHSVIQHNGSHYLSLRSNAFIVQDAAATKTIFYGDPNGQSSLYFNGSKKLETINGGVDITGNLQIDSLHCLGQINLDSDIDVEGHTNLDNVSIAGVTTTTDNINIDADNKKLQIGDGQDLQLFHNGSQSHITNNTGILKITGVSGQKIDFMDGSSYYARFNSGSQVDLFHNNGVKFSTKDYGVAVYDNIRLTTGGDGYTFIGDSDTGMHNPFNGGLNFKVNGSDRLTINNVGIATFSNVNVEIKQDLDVDGHTNLDNVSIAGITTFADNAKAIFGTGGDMQIFHDGTNSRIENDATNLFLQSQLINLANHDGSEVMINANANGAVNLYHDNSKKLETTSYGAAVTGGINFSGDSLVQDNVSIFFGASNDLQIIHDGTNSIIDTNTGDLILRGDSDDVKILAEDDIVLRDNDDSTNFIHCVNGGGVKLYHNGTQIFETYSSGVTVSGGQVNVNPGSGNANLQLKSGSGSVYQTISFKASDNTQISYITSWSGGTLFLNGTSTIVSSIAGTEISEIASTGFHPRTDSARDLGLNAKRWRNVYADTLYGDGSNLTGISGVTINNNADNRVITGSGTAATLNGESNVIIDSSGRLLIGTTTEGHPAGDKITVADSGNAGITIRSGTTSNGALYFSDGTSGAAEYRGGVVYHHDGNYLRFYTNGTERFRIDAAGQVLPGTDDSQNLGSSSKRWANIYAADMHFSNKGKTNDVDGTWGDWTLQEGEDSVYMINNRTGKKYAITMKEVN